MKGLKNQRIRGLALVLSFVCALVTPVGAATKKSASTANKSAASSSSTARKKSTASASTAKKGSTTAHKGTTSRSRTATTAAAARRKPAAPPRQNSPTPDRYREIQQALVERGYADRSPDGVWGPQWVDSLRRFQADQNLDADGKLGALSLIALGLGPKRQALQLPPPGASNQTMPGQQLLAKPVE